MTSLLSPHATAQPIPPAFIKSNAIEPSNKREQVHPNDDLVNPEGPSENEVALDLAKLDEFTTDFLNYNLCARRNPEQIMLNGVEVLYYDIYNVLIDLGGYSKVSQKKLWNKVYSMLTKRANQLSKSDNEFEIQELERYCIKYFKDYMSQKKSLGSTEGFNAMRSSGSSRPARGQRKNLEMVAQKQNCQLRATSTFTSKDYIDDLLDSDYEPASKKRKLSTKDAKASSGNEPEPKIATKVHNDHHYAATAAAEDEAVENDNLRYERPLPALWPSNKNGFFEKHFFETGERVQVNTEFLDLELMEKELEIINFGQKLEKLRQEDKRSANDSSIITFIVTLSELLEKPIVHNDFNPNAIVEHQFSKDLKEFVDYSERNSTCYAAQLLLALREGSETVQHVLYGMPDGQCQIIEEHVTEDYGMQFSALDSIELDSNSNDKIDKHNNTNVDYAGAVARIRFVPSENKLQYESNTNTLPINDHDYYGEKLLRKSAIKNNPTSSSSNDRSYGNNKIDIRNITFINSNPPSKTVKLNNQIRNYNSSGASTSSSSSSQDGKFAVPLPPKMKIQKNILTPNRILGEVTKEGQFCPLVPGTKQFGL